MKDKFKVFHVALTESDCEKLDKRGITDYIYYKGISDSLFDSIQIDNKLLTEIDQLIIENSNGRFNLNASIISDRTYIVLSYREALFAAQVHYLTWKRILEQIGHIDYLLHEPCSLFFNHIAALLCKAQGGTYLWQSTVPDDSGNLSFLLLTHDDYSCADIPFYMNYYKKNPQEIDYIRCEKFVTKFKDDYTVRFQNSCIVPHSTVSLIYRYLRVNIHRRIKFRKFDRQKDTLRYWLNNNNVGKIRLTNIREYRKKKVRFENMVEGEQYYYYSFHLEPEATVFYLGDGLYANQVKLIENIAASLPAGIYLYVKDHPHEFAYRCADDYLRLMRIPNIRLIPQSIPGKVVIKNAIGVFSINGTVGFEALLLGKEVYCFGHNYYTYCPLVKYVHNIKNLRDIIYQNRMNVSESEKQKNQTLFYAYIYSYLKSLHKGNPYFFGRLSPDSAIDKNNIKQIADSLTNYFSRF